MKEYAEYPVVTWEVDGPARRIYPPPTTNLFGPNGVFRGQAWVVPRWLRREARRRLRAHGYTLVEPRWSLGGARPLGEAR